MLQSPLMFHWKKQFQLQRMGGRSRLYFFCDNELIFEDFLSETIYELNSAP